MRLDKYLKLARLIRRRTVAKDAADAGRVLVNGRPAKPSHEVRPGDHIEVRMGRELILVEVLAADDSMRPQEARESYRVLRHERGHAAAEEQED